MACCAQLDIVDIGIVEHFLEERLPERIALTDDASRIALAHASRILLLWQLEDAGATHLVQTPAQERVLCLQWLSLTPAALPGASPLHVMLAGTEAGYLRSWLDDGTPLVSVLLRASPLLSLSINTVASDGELLALHADGTLVHAAVDDIGAAIHTCAASVDAVHIGGTPASTHGDGDGAGGSERGVGVAREVAEERFRQTLCAFRLGGRPTKWVCAASGGALLSLPLEVHEVFEEPEEPPPLCVALVAADGLQLHLLQAAEAHAAQGSSPARALAHGALSLLDSFGFGRSSSKLRTGVHALAARLPEASALPIAGESACVRTLADYPRCYLAASPEPRRRWIAVSDSLGRVLLLEARTLVVLRVWKGYRDAQCAWLDPELEPATSASPETRVPRRVPALLAIYAPRRGLLEVWSVPSGSRVSAQVVGPDCCLLAPARPLRLGPTEAGSHEEPRTQHGCGPVRCYLLQKATGTLSLVQAQGHSPER